MASKVDGFEWKYIEYSKEQDRVHTEGLWLNEGENLYFTPNLFSRRGRKQDFALPSRWLYADLDEVNPESIDINPTLWWETSPGRFQALWYLQQRLKPETHRRLNQKLSYYLGADKSGWNLSKILRVPGSVSTKHGDPFHIVCEGLPSNDEEFDLIYDAREVWSEVKHVPTTIVGNGQVDMTATMDAARVMKKLPTRLQKRVMRKSVNDRSDYIHAVVMSLHEHGLKGGDILNVMRASPVAQSKHDTDEKLKKDIKRILSKVPKEDTSDPKPDPKLNGLSSLKAENFTSFMARSFHVPGYLVDGFWSTSAHGIIAGGHKSYKSLLVQDLLASVASGTPFLNTFDVPEQGHVIYIQQENSEAFIQDRFQKLVFSKGLAGERIDSKRVKLPAELPISVVSNKDFDLTNEEHIEWLEKQVKKNKTKLIVFDPLYLMMPGVDENSAAGMIPVLKRLLEVKQKYGVGIVLVHHYKKQNRDAPMYAEDDRISGTSAFGRFYESLILVERGDEPHSVKLYPKHRMQPPGGVIHVEFDMGPMGDTYYNPVVTQPRDEAADLYTAIEELVEKEPGITVASVAKLLGMRAERVKRMVERSGKYKLKGAKGGSPKLIRTTR